MAHHYRLAIVLLGIALQAIDAVIGARGHSHVDPVDHCSAAVPDAHQDACCHTHGAMTRQESSPPENSPADPHDDCSLCRHFSQAVAPVAFFPELTRSEQVWAAISLQAESHVSQVATTHAARGPPAWCA